MDPITGVEDLLNAETGDRVHFETAYWADVLDVRVLGPPDYDVVGCVPGESIRSFDGDVWQAGGEVPEKGDTVVMLGDRDEIRVAFGWAAAEIGAFAPVEFAGEE